MTNKRHPHQRLASMRNRVATAEVTQFDAAHANADVLHLLRSGRVASEAGGEGYFFAESQTMPDVMGEKFSFINENMSIQCSSAHRKSHTEF